MDKSRFDRILTMAAEEEASDLLFAVGHPPLWGARNEWLQIRDEKLTERDTELLASILLQNCDEELESVKTVEVAYELKGAGRFRASVFRETDRFKIVMRVVPRVKSFKQLNLPEQIVRIAEMKRGLVLVTGATGQGKSTTIATMIEHINRSRTAHIVTIEDPIEFTYSEGESIITQREVGTDVESYEAGLRDVLRQRPNVIMAGEIRDGDAFEAVLKAAETGHLVLSAIHTDDAVSTIERILSYYPNEKRMACARLAKNLAAIISLRLLPCAKMDMGCDMVPAVEIMMRTPIIAACLRSDEKIYEIASHVENGRTPWGMQSFDQHLFELAAAGIIAVETAVENATRTGEFEAKLIQENISLKPLVKS